MIYHSQQSNMPLANPQMSAVNSNYYYSSVGQTINEQIPQSIISNQHHQIAHHQHAPSNLSNKSGGQPSNKQNVSQSTSNAIAAMQAYASGAQGGIYQVNNKIANNPQRKTHSNDQQQQQQLQQQQQFSPPSNSVSSSSTSAIMTQILMGAHKKSLGSSSNTSNLNRYESLQSKLKNKRRLQPAGNLIGSNSSQNIGPPSIPNSSGKNIQASGDQKFNLTQKLIMTGQIGGGSQGQGNGQLSNRKQLKISVDQHSDSSFNNISIKSADKQNSVVRQIAAGILSHKNNTQTINIKELSNQISPSSHNGGSILQNFNSSQNSVYSSNFSNNSRFNNRPKNPTDSSSLSSKHSDSLNSHAALTQINQKSVLADLKKNLLLKAQQNHLQQQQQTATTQQQAFVQNSKQTAIQMIKEQQQMLIKQHQQSDSLSDNLSGGVNGGSFSSSHSQNPANEAATILQKPLQTKLYNSINTKIQTSQQQLKGSNSIANLSKIGQTIQLGAQSHVPATPGYKSKFTLMSRVNEKPQIMESTSKNVGGDSYRRQTDLSKKKASVSKTSGIHCGAPFSPKQSHTAGNSKIAGLQKNNHQQQQVYLSNIPQGYRNNGGLTIKASAGGASIGSNYSKKSGRDNQNKTQDIVKNATLNQNPTTASIKPKLVKHENTLSNTQDQLLNQIQVTAQLVGIPQGKLNMDQIQSLLKQQQNHLQQQNLYKGGSHQADTIQEERFEDSEQNTKRESTTNNNKQSNANLIAASLQDVQLQQQLSNATSHSYLNVVQKSKSLLTINLEQSKSTKRFEDSQVQAPPPPPAPVQTNQFEEIKQNSTLQAMKEKLKTQISLQHHPFSNPNQPSSQIEVAEVAEPFQSINAVQALNLYLNHLNDYERTEILGYNEIYYLGLTANQSKIKGSSKMPSNYGYDDERGDYTVVLQDHLCYRYQVLDFLGKGSFGQALKCKDHKTNEIVAAKIIRNKKRFQHQAGIELSILSYLKQNDPDDVNNIIRVKEYFIFRKHLVITFELLSINLYEFIKNNNFNGVSLSLIRRFAIQILQALKYQREHGIIHCDLKPENILLKQPNKSGIKIIDYGSSCFQNQRIYTYIQSRFYRAPEIVMGIPYTTSIDMWSFGCILAELFKGYPLFPGENEIEQLAYIMEIKGVPEDYLLELSSRRKLFFDSDNQPIIVANSKGKKRRPLTKTLKAVLKCTDQSFIDFLDQCLDWDPVRRMTPLEALQHPWILEGLPDKVLMHHQRMFGTKDDKNNIKEATLTAIQGFPPDAENNTIFEQFKQRPLQEIDLSELTQHYGKKLLNKPLTLEEEEDEERDFQTQNGESHQTASFQNQEKTSNTAKNSVRQKQIQGSKTIQNLMQELVEEKQQKNGKQGYKSSNTNTTFENEQACIYGSSNVNFMRIIEVDTGALSSNIRNQNAGMAQSSSIIPDNNEDDIEEGVNFNKTQKIPMSLIKQQEKIPIQQHVPFYNPKVSGPKLNNYISQAATAINKKNQHAASTSNLNITGQKRGSEGQLNSQVNYSMNNNNINVGQLTINSSMVHGGHYNNPLITNRSSVGTDSTNQFAGQGGNGTNNISFQQPQTTSEANSLNRRQLALQQAVYTINEKIT